MTRKQLYKKHNFRFSKHHSSNRQPLLSQHQQSPTTSSTPSTNSPRTTTKSPPCFPSKPSSSPPSRHPLPWLFLLPKHKLATALTPPYPKPSTSPAAAGTTALSSNCLIRASPAPILLAVSLFHYATSSVASTVLEIVANPSAVPLLQCDVLNTGFDKRDSGLAKRGCTVKGKCKFGFTCQIEIECQLM
jgi:hypothetical protein